MAEFDRTLQDVKAEILARSDIVEIVGQYTRLKKTGKNWTGLCPFHNDKKPSFNVSPQLGIYKCFSCGEAGDLIKFVQKKESLEFVDALEWLARRAGIAFERRAPDPQKASEREQALELNNLAVKFYQDRLARSQEARDYLARRAILKSTQEQWDLGFATPDWEALTYHFQQKRINLELAAKIGLIKPREQGGYVDTFRNRLMFPIHDLQGHVIAFGGRAMDDHPAKYLNSPASILFDKSSTLYGLYFAKKKLGGDTPPVFTEGYMDVITTHQAGFTQCVATLGTSMTEQHARLLIRYNPRVILCYDRDGAGIKAALKGAGIWESLGVENAEVRVARLPDGDDPDSLLKERENGKALFQAALDNAIPRIDFEIELVRQKCDLHTEEGRSAALAEIIPILATIPSQAVRSRYAQNLVVLHPLHARYGLSRAIEQILMDVETYARQMKSRPSPRDHGYPLTEEANRDSLKEQPEQPGATDPGRLRPPNPQQWGGVDRWPNTREVIRKDGSGANGQGNGYNNNNYKGDGYRGKNGRGRYRDSPIGDPSPPPLNAPVLSGIEKTERQLLRALFSPEWRVIILSRVTPALLVTPHGQRLFAMIARTAAGPDGGIDPRPLLQAAQDAEDVEAQKAGADKEKGLTGGIEAKSAGQSAGQNEGETPAAGNFLFNLQNNSKFSDFIREVLEDSVYMASNEQVNEKAIADCIARLLKHREERDLREKSALLHQIENLPPEQQRAAIEQYQQKMRALRGSPPKDEEK